MGKLQNIHVAVLVGDGFEEVELTEPCKELKKEGASVSIVSPNTHTVRAWKYKEWSQDYPVDKQLDKINPKDFHALLLPGGVMNPDKLRMNEQAVSFVKHFMLNNKPIAAICHAPWILIGTKLLKNKHLTAYASLKTDLLNAGAIWKDEEVVVDKGLVTSRNPGDLPVFVRTMIEVFQNHHLL